MLAPNTKILTKIGHINTLGIIIEQYLKFKFLLSFLILIRSAFKILLAAFAKIIAVSIATYNGES